MVKVLAERGIELDESAAILRKIFAVRSFSKIWSSVLEAELYYLGGSELHRPVDVSEDGLEEANSGVAPKPSLFDIC